MKYSNASSEPKRVSKNFDETGRASTIMTNYQSTLSKSNALTKVEGNVSTGLKTIQKEISPP
jgi:hypothetical protein